MMLNKRFNGFLERIKGTPRSAEDERLLQLFRNRVELKKEFSSLQENNVSLLRQLRKQDSAQLQSQERLQKLEAFLGDPDNGMTALVFYQLRSLWSQASRRLAELSIELTEQQQERERKLQQIEFDQNRQRRIGKLDGTIIEMRSRMDSLEARGQLLQRQLQGMRWFWHRRKRNELRTELAQLTLEQSQVGVELLALEEQRDALASAVIPEFTELTVEGKRLVNTATLSFAQQLLDRLGHDGLAIMAKDASSRQVYEVQYGSSQECQLLLDGLQPAMKMLRESPRDLRDLKQLTQRLRNNAFYRSDHETVPVPESIGTVAVQSRMSSGDAAQSRMTEEVNVLLDDYWDLYSVLLH